MLVQRVKKRVLQSRVINISSNQLFFPRFLHIAYVQIYATFVAGANYRRNTAVQMEHVHLEINMAVLYRLWKFHSLLVYRPIRYLINAFYACLASSISLW